MEGFWGRQSTNTLDRATAMMPRMLYDRLDELGIDFGVIYPDRRARHPAHRRRRDPARGDPRLQHRHRRLLRQARGPPDAGGGHPDAHAGGGDRGARVRAPSSSAPRSACSAAACAGRIAGGQGRRSRRSAASPWLRRARHRQRRTTTTRCGRNAASSGWRRPSMPAAAATALRNSPEQLHLQPYRPFRRRRARRRQGRCSWAA